MIALKLRSRELVEMGDKLFSQRTAAVSLWQEIADNFYPERADFTVSRSLGTEFASNLMSGAPVLARRDLANQFAAMLRPKGKEWFSLAPKDAKLAERRNVVAFSEWSTSVMRRAMYDSAAKFARATKEGDNDFAAFGQAVLSVELDPETMKLLYRCWHLRDVVWAENERGDIYQIHRKWKLSARDLCAKYKEKVPSKYHELAKKEPFKEIECRHVIVLYDQYDYNPKVKPVRAERFGFMSMLVLKEDDVLLNETPVIDHPYIIPRWQTVSGSQYAHSPCTVIALPDARLLQRITFTLLEAGEKATNPPMIAIQEAIRSDVAIYAGGITWADAEYDERLGEVLRPLTMDHSGLKFGWEMGQKHEEMVRKAFFLDQINLPAYDGAAMTATEIRVRTEEYVRAALPLFEPMEAEYNGALCEKTFNLLNQHGGFGSPRDWPQELVGAELDWQFSSPLSEAAQKQKAFGFQEAANLLAVAAQIDPALRSEWDVRTDFRDALRSVKAAVVDEEVSDAALADAKQKEQLQEVIGLTQNGAVAAEQLGKAAKSFQGIAA